MCSTGSNYTGKKFCCVLFLRRASSLLPFPAFLVYLFLSHAVYPPLSLSVFLSECLYLSQSVPIYLLTYLSSSLHTSLSSSLSFHLPGSLSLFLYPHLSLSTYSISLPLSVDMDLIIFVTSSVSDWPSGLLAVCEWSLSSTGGSRTVHLWNETRGGIGDTPPHDGSVFTAV